MRIAGLGLGVAVGCWLLVPGGAAARTSAWKVTGVVSGSYANAVTATGDTQGCAARYAERVTGVRVTFRSDGAVVYDPVAHTFVGMLRYGLRGRWAVGGAYTPLAPQADGTLACGASSTPVSCGAKVVADDGHRTSTSGSARLAVDGTARGTIVSKVVAPRLTEQYADAGTPPAGWPGACTLSTDDETIPALPVFGLSATTVLDRAVAAPLRLPTAKLRGHRAFSVMVQVERPEYCPSAAFAPCSEQGSFRLRVKLTPDKR